MFSAKYVMSVYEKIKFCVQPKEYLLDFGQTYHLFQGEYLQCLLPIHQLETNLGK